jgi:hypothetical protein
MKLVLIDSPIRCPYYKEATCFIARSKRKKAGVTVTRFHECGWHQGMAADMFPKNCPLPDYVDPGDDTMENYTAMIKIRKSFRRRIALL